MASPTNRQPVWVTTLFEKHIKPTRTKFGNIPQGIPAVMCEDLLDSYINQLGVGVHEAVRLVSIHLFTLIFLINLYSFLIVRMPVPRPLRSAMARSKL